MSTDIVLRRSGTLAERETAIEAAVEMLLSEVPEGGKDGELNILEQILLATTLDDIDRPWAINGLGQFVDQAIQIDSLTRMPSDYTEGYAWFLVVSGVVIETGEALSFSTSSRAIITQLIVLNRHRLLPAQFWVRVAKKPTERGFYPQHLEPYREYHTARRQASQDAPARGPARPAGQVDPRVTHARELAEQRKTEREAAAKANIMRISTILGDQNQATTTAADTTITGPGF